MITIGSAELAGKSNRDIARALLDNARQSNPELNLALLFPPFVGPVVRWPYGWSWSVISQLLFATTSDGDTYDVRPVVDWTSRNTQLVYDFICACEDAHPGTTAYYQVYGALNVDIHLATFDFGMPAAFAVMFLFCLAAEFESMYDELLAH